jgi:hypothetical protein
MTNVIKAESVLPRPAALNSSNPNCSLKPEMVGSIRHWHYFPKIVDFLLHRIDDK